MVNRFITAITLVFISSLLAAQGFPDAQKQPRMKEQRHNHKKYARKAHRRHVKRGTVYMQPAQQWSTTQTPIWLLADKRSLLNIG